MLSGLRPAAEGGAGLPSGYGHLCCRPEKFKAKVLFTSGLNLLIP